MFTKKQALGYLFNIAPSIKDSKGTQWTPPKPLHIQWVPPKPRQKPTNSLFTYDILGIWNF